MREIAAMGLTYRADGPITIPHQNIPAQEIIAGLHTGLTVLKLREPSLEDAYIEYLMRTGGEAA